ncbi:MAG: stage III sporulation protein AD, partial [Clostridia bacterium]|nr:stage III sporulation protein AD [Clostridia bacterium]
GLGANQLKLVFKVIGIAYVVQFAAEACRDAGEGAVASKVELAGRVLIVAVALPALMAVLSLLTGLLQKP